MKKGITVAILVGLMVALATAARGKQKTVSKYRWDV